MSYSWFSSTQALQAPKEKKSVLKDLIRSYITQNEQKLKDQEVFNKDQRVFNKSMEASLKNLENQVGQLARILSKRPRVVYQVILKRTLGKR